MKDYFKAFAFNSLFGPIFMYQSMTVRCNNMFHLISINLRYNYCSKYIILSLPIKLYCNTKIRKRYMAGNCVQKFPFIVDFINFEKDD